MDSTSFGYREKYVSHVYVNRPKQQHEEECPLAYTEKYPYDIMLSFFLTK